MKQRVRDGINTACRLSSIALRIVAALVFSCAAVPLAQAEELTLPATFAGVLPCADCEGIAHRLTLRADGLYRLRRDYLGKPEGSFTEVGRWTAPADGSPLSLRGGRNTVFFKVENASTLRLLDTRGQPIESPANLDLRRTSQVEPVSELLRWRGEFLYLADAATFTDCASGLRWPVAMSADYAAAERNYLRFRSARACPSRCSWTAGLKCARRWRARRASISSSSVSTVRAPGRVAPRRRAGMARGLERLERARPSP